MWDLYKNSPYKKVWGSTGLGGGTLYENSPYKKAWGSTGLGGGTLYENSPYKKKRSLWLNVIALANYCLKWNVI